MNQLVLLSILIVAVSLASSASIKDEVDFRKVDAFVDVKSGPFLPRALSYLQHHDHHGHNGHGHGNDNYGHSDYGNHGNHHGHGHSDNHHDHNHGHQNYYGK